MINNHVAEKIKEISEDVAKSKKNELQKDIDVAINMIETMFEHKETDIMRI